MVRIDQLLRHATALLGQAGIPSPSSEARLLLSETLGVSSAWVMAHPEALPSPDLAELARVQILVELVELTIAGTLMLLAFRLLVGGNPEAERVTARRDR